MFICCLVNFEKIQWIGSKTTYENLIELLKNEITIRKAFLNVTNEKIVIEYNGEKVDYSVKKANDIPEKMLPFEKMLIPVDIVQYSKNKSFKNAKTVWDKKGGGLKAIKKLKPNTTYYIRYSITTDVSTLKGYKKIGGIWSKTIKVKTKK